jgi:hypothetical protein
LNFTLISDTDHKIAEAYGVGVEKSMYCRKYFGNERTTFIIDEDGNIAKVLPKVKPAEQRKSGPGDRVTRVREVPCSTSNLGAGFDCIGLALKSVSSSPTLSPTVRQSRASRHDRRH